MERAADMGEYLRSGLRSVRRNHPGTLAGIRGMGLWCAFDVNPAHLAQPLVEEMARRGVVVGSMLNSAGTVRVAPPLVVEQEHIDRFLGILESSLNTLEG